MKKMKKFLAFACALAMVLSLAACGSKTSGTTTTTPTDSSSDVKTGFTFALLVPTMNHTYFENAVTFAQSVCDTLGCTLTVYNADSSADTMIKNVEDAVNSGADAIIIDPYYSSGTKCAEECKTAGIPMIAWDSDIEEFDPQTTYDSYVGFVGPDDEDAGYNMACYLFDHTTASADGTMYIGVIQGTPGTAVAANREKGFDKAYDEYTAKGVKISVVGRVDGDFNAETSQNVTEDLVQANPNINGIWAANGGTGTGVMNALTNLGYTPGKDVTVVAMDMNPENVKAVQDGTLAYDIGGHWLVAGDAIIMAFDYLNGYQLTTPKWIMKLLPITQDNVQTFYDDFPNNVPVNFDIKSACQAYGGSADYASFDVNQMLG
ncbi:MAG: substrate-binding domain-containing protein [Oscillospiraceae bacterium]|nr:substrate-binding domain-containing protein [Oscillospiraceae bacterium]